MSNKLRCPLFHAIPYDSNSQQTGDIARGDFSTVTYSYDDDGNRTSDGQTYDSRGHDRLTRDNTWTYQYDNEGNLTSKTLRSDSSGWSYGYDLANRLVSATRNDSTGNPTFTITYDYDVFGNRVERDLMSGGSTARAKFAYDGQDVWADLDASNNLQVRYLRGDAVDQLFARRNADGTALWYLTDRQGSVVDLITTQGAAAERVLYNAFGVALTIFNQMPGNVVDRYQFTGRDVDPDTRLQFNRARWYDPSTGRWQTPDPLGFAAGDANLYRYAGNSPANSRDPSGLLFGWDDLLFSALGAIGSLVGQGISDALSGRFSGWEAYVGAAVGGAAGGLTFANTYSFTLAGAVGAGVGNATTQGLRIATGQQTGFDTASFGVSVVAGTVGGAIGGAVFGQTAGSFAQAGFRSIVGSTWAAGAAGGAIGGFYEGALGAAQQGNNIISGGLSGAGGGALVGGVSAAGAAGLVYGGIRAAPYAAGYARALGAEVRGAASGDVAFSGLGPLGLLSRAARRAVQADLLEQIGMSETPAQSGKGMQNPAVREAVEKGDIAHALLQGKMRSKGWLVDRVDTAVVDPTTGETVYPDALSLRGHPVEIKPRTPTGINRGQSQLSSYERATGRRGRVLYYDPDQF